MAKVLKSELFANIKAIDEAKVETALQEALKDFNKKIVVLDDDPTGVQTVHDISVYTDWSEASIASGFEEKNSMFFILTNSRAFSADYTKEQHTLMAQRIAAEAKKRNQGFMIISRSDSTLRGHYPLETETLRSTVEAAGCPAIDGEVMMPFFKEGGRFTIGNVHYVQEEDYLTPAGETEFAKDKTFSYTKSNIAEYIEEKTKGRFTKESVTCISLEDIRAFNVDKITEQLMAVKDFNKVIVNAVDYVDVKVFAIALIKAMKQGKNFMFRTAAAFTKVIGGVSDKPLLTRDELVAKGNDNGGLIIIGSHVQKTTKQFEELKKSPYVKCIEFNHMLVLEPDKLEEELKKIVAEVEADIKQGQTVVVYTGRKRFDAGSEEESLRVSVKISEAITSIVSRLSIQPSFLIAKGGITSSDVGTKGLSVKHALVMGQVAPGIPVWKTGSESKFPDMAYVIFPGNVGAVDTLRKVVDMLCTK
ncbi:four-carbon acid sugar kinase family protein [uncultured Anaerovibrio sp.]|uniref:four-carbon acid sugar kinase family protein n=1 Tax=uncultured Anaerovibrio sp. TaxID=361586 RepID=UPI00260B684C|nr:four-carbon acid sugar kinase family protein [uncultured Anaerovibrio sp.]